MMMMPRHEERILIASTCRDDAVNVLDATPWLEDSAVEWVRTSTEAADRLSDPEHRFTLALIDRDLVPDPAPALFHFVRRDRESPFPGLAIGMIGSGIRPVDVRRAVNAGCLLTLSRPFDMTALGAAVHRYPMDRTDFIVSGAYVGPDRRRVTDPGLAARRRSSGVEQAIASTAARYDIAPATTGFRFKRLRADGAPASAALSLRNGLRRATLAPAVAHIGVKKKEGLGLLDRQAGAMTQTWRHLQASLAPRLLERLNGQALESAELASQRGLLLLSAITGSLVKYSAGRHRLGPRLVSFLRAHLDGVTTALRHRIDDDGGPVGRGIMTVLKDAERRFAEADMEPAGEPDFAVTARRAGRA